MGRDFRLFICVALAQLLSVFTAACDLPGGYADIGKPLDTIVKVDPKGHSTWMRADESAAEMLLLGKTGDDRVGQIVLVRVERSTETTLTAGTYTKFNDNQIEVHYEKMFHYPFEPNTKPLNKKGATSVEIDVTIDYTVEYQKDTLLLSEGHNQQEFTAIEALVARLDPTSEDDWLVYARFFNFCIMTSQARVPGFGSGRMMQFLGKQVPFKGMISGEFIIQSSGILKPVTHIEYKNFSDFSGVVLNGVQSTVVSMKGDGHMYGAIDFEFPADPENPDVTVTGAVDYGTRSGDAAVELENGTAAGGRYRVSIEGAPAIDIDYRQFNDMDLTPLFL